MVSGTFDPVVGNLISVLTIVLVTAGIAGICRLFDWTVTSHVGNQNPMSDNAAFSNVECGYDATLTTSTLEAQSTSTLSKITSALLVLVTFEMEIVVTLFGLLNSAHDFSSGISGTSALLTLVVLVLFAFIEITLIGK